MTTYEYLSIILTVLVLVLIPLVALLVRVVIRQATVEATVQQAIKDFQETGKEIYAQIREDRQANNRRLTWLEQNLYRRTRDKDNAV